MEEKINWNSVNQGIDAIIAASQIGDKFTLEDGKIWQVEEKGSNFLIVIHQEMTGLACDHCHNDKPENFRPYPHLGKDTYQCTICSEMTHMAVKVILRRKISGFTNISLKKRIETSENMERVIQAAT